MSHVRTFSARALLSRTPSSRIASLFPSSSISSSSLHRSFSSSSSSSSDFAVEDGRYILGTYARQPFQFVSGSGCILYDNFGKSYLDFYSGIAVNALGHSDPDWLNALQTQAKKLAHVSNLFYSKPQVELAKKLLTTGGAEFDKVFFCNSGTEANEAALKFSRKYQYNKYLERIEKAKGSSSSSSSPPHTKTRIVAFNGGFHGRTIGALSMTYKAAYKTPFYPLMDGVTFVNLNDKEAASKAIDENTCAVIIEPVQGEGGVHACDPAFLQWLRQKTQEVDALLICDEVQVGLGRLGSFYAHTSFNVRPDLVTLAKPLAGGLPIGAVLLRQPVASSLKPGDHGTTFAGGPLVTATALAVVEKIGNESFLKDVQRKGQFLLERLKKLRNKLDAADKADGVRVKEIRSLGYNFAADRGEGRSLLVGLELNVPVSKIITLAAAKGVVLIGAGENTLRLVPPLIITEEQIEQAIGVIEEIATKHTVTELK